MTLATPAKLVKAKNILNKKAAETQIIHKFLLLALARLLDVNSVDDARLGWILIILSTH